MALSDTSLDVYSAEFVASRSSGVPMFPGTTFWKARVEAALPALLRPLRHLRTVSIESVEFVSLSALLRVLSGLLRVRAISLTSVSMLHASERYLWPPSLRLAKLRTFELDRCRLPMCSIPILVSISPVGRPEMTPHILPDSERLCGVRLHPLTSSSCGDLYTLWIVCPQFRAKIPRRCSLNGPS